MTLLFKKPYQQLLDSYIPNTSFLDNGSTRYVYRSHDGKHVYKLAISNGGLLQNANEITQSRTDKSLFVEVLDTYGPDHMPNLIIKEPYHESVEHRLEYLFQTITGYDIIQDDQPDKPFKIKLNATTNNIDRWLLERYLRILANIGVINSSTHNLDHAEFILSYNQWCDLSSSTRNEAFTYIFQEYFEDEISNDILQNDEVFPSNIGIKTEDHPEMFSFIIIDTGIIDNNYFIGENNTTLYNKKHTLFAEDHTRMQQLKNKPGGANHAKP